MAIKRWWIVRKWISWDDQETRVRIYCHSAVGQRRAERTRLETQRHWAQLIGKPPVKPKLFPTSDCCGAPDFPSETDRASKVMLRRRMGGLRAVSSIAASLH